MLTWHAAITQAVERICSIDADVAWTYYDLPYKTLIQSDIAPVDPAFTFYIEVAHKVEKNPSYYKVTGYKVQRLLNSGDFRVWFGLRPIQITDLM
jgi:hypothetical protein